MSTALTLAESAVPRYTSYPTAPHFSGRRRDSSALDRIRAVRVQLPISSGRLPS
jgi:hypothetical protein